MVGASLGFLWFNAPPALVFMGDTGSLASGGALGAVAVMTNHELLLAVIGGVFVLETISVIVQVVSFKLTGKRLFRMAPLHHHFEQSGWPESTIVMRFWIVRDRAGPDRALDAQAALSPAMIPLPAMQGKTAAVLGLGLSGGSACRALLASGARVWAWDDDPARRSAAAGTGLALVDLRVCNWARIDCLVLSPGIPARHPRPTRR